MISADLSFVLPFRWLLQIGAEIQITGQPDNVFFLTQLICHLMFIKFHLIVPILVNGLMYIEG
jgi:hypothetical protein